MITGALKSQVDKVWDAFWSGGIGNPLTVIEQITYLLFIKRLDELHTVRERKANRLGSHVLLPHQRHLSRFAFSLMMAFLLVWRIEIGWGETSGQGGLRV